MFSNITDYKDDPIEGFQVRLKNSANPDKLDLGLGVYRDEAGEGLCLRQFDKPLLNITEVPL